MKAAAIHTSRDTETKQALFSKKGGELKLSGPALVELLRAVLDKGKPFRFRAKGFSMSPFIKDNDVITVFPLTDASIRSGDVVAFIRPEMKKLVIHRVVWRKGEYFHIKGDNIPHTDELIPETNILGRIVRVERNGKEVFFGLGPERFLIALLVRMRIFPALLPFLWGLVRPVVKKRLS